MTFYAGIDPGFGQGAPGAIAVVSPDYPGWWDCIDMPVHDKVVNATAVYAFVCEWSGAEDRLVAALERQGARPGEGVSSSFNAGRGYGALIATLQIAGIPYEIVGAATWKKAMGCSGTDKEKDVARAIELFPDSERLFKFKKYHGRADALLIAEFLRRKREMK